MNNASIRIFALSLNSIFLFSIVISAELNSIDSGKIVFSRRISISEGYSIYSVNTDGSQLTQLTYNEDDFHARWSPDGKSIAFVRLSGLEITQLMIINGNRDPKGISNYRGITNNPSWSPDGKQLVFSSMGALHTVDTSSINGSNETILYKSGLHARWANNGTDVYFHSTFIADSLGISKGNLFKININSLEVEQVTSQAMDDEYFGHLSPNENLIVFSYLADQGDRRILVTDLQMSYVDTLTNGQNDDYPRWSSDGSSIVFMRDLDPDPNPNNTRYAIYIMSKDGTDPTQVTFPDTSDKIGDWFPDHFIDTVTVGISTIQEYVLPKHAQLSQNFPNPFNPVTTIRYELPTNSHVNLTIYDMLGREVAVLAEGFKPSGFYSTQWNASNVPSGIYFIQMVAGDFRQVRKVMVLK